MSIKDPRDQLQDAIDEGEINKIITLLLVNCYDVFMTILKSHPDREDLIQTTLVTMRIFLDDNSQKIPDANGLISYTITVLKRGVLGLYRKNGIADRNQELVSRDNECGEPPPERQFILGVLLFDIHNAIENVLNMNERYVVKKRMEEFSHRLIAESLQTTESNSRKIHNTACRKLRERLDEKHSFDDLTDVEIAFLGQKLGEIIHGSQPSTISPAE